MKIKLVFRKPFTGAFSIEYLFNNLYPDFVQQSLSVEKVELPYFSKGLIGRIKNTFFLTKYSDVIVHVTGDVHYTILGAWRAKRLLTIHDFTFMDRTAGIAKFIYYIFWIVLPIQFAHKVTVVSEATKQELLTYVKVNPNKIVVVYNFIDDIFKPKARAFNSTAPRILQIGTAFNKNVHNLVSALEGISCVLVIIGKLENDVKVLLVTKGIQYVHFENLRIEDLYQQYLEADMLVYASFKEGFGMPILEAQATGLPVITSNVSSMPEIAGNGAFFIDPYSVDSLRVGIQTLIENQTLREQVVNNGYTNVKRFSRSVVAGAYKKIYDSI